MRRVTRVFIIGNIGILASVLLLALLMGNRAAAQRAPVDATATATESPTPTETSFPTCNQSTDMTLAFSNPAPQLGDRITVTAVLTNTGDCLMGLPLYGLRIDNPNAVAVFWESDHEVYNGRAIYGGQADTAEFVIVIANTGNYTVSAYVSYEVHVGYPGPAYWGGTRTTPVSVTVPGADVGTVIMTQAAYAAGCLADDAFIQSTLTISSTEFACALAAGHSIGAELTDFGDAAAARAAFAARAAGQTIVPFADCRSSFATTSAGMDPLVVTEVTWVGERWLVVGESQDDTPITGGITGAGAVHDALVANGLLTPCRQSYLPNVTIK